ncbi:MAG: hypothetical protein V4519_03560 [Patescibacteria group bacterium]
MGLFKKIKTVTSTTTTYRAGLLQTKAYRALKQHTAAVLDDSNISTVEWGFLGLLRENPKGLRLSILANELGVEAPFVTQMVNRLKPKGFFEVVTDPEDSRAKIMCLTQKGIEFVDSTEKILREKTRRLFHGASLTDLAAYLTVLQTIIDNYEGKE